MKNMLLRATVVAVLPLMTAFMGPAIVLGAGAGDIEKDITFIDTLYSVTMNGPDQIWTCGFNGIVYYSGDGGSTWTKQRTETDKTLFDIVFFDDKKGLTCGQGGTILQTSDGGQKWKKVKVPTKTALFEMSFSNAQRGCAVGDQGGALYTTDGGTTWEEAEIEEEISGDRPEEEEIDPLLQGEDLGKEFILYGVSLADRNTGYAVGEFGAFLKTNDGGKTWTMSAVDEAEGKSLFGVFAQSPDHIWAVGIDGIMLFSGDGGESWRSVDVPVKKHLFSIRFEGENGYAIGKEGIYLMSTDGGATWRQIDIGAKFYLQDIILNERFGWIVGAHGWVLGTNDGGKSFRILRRAP